MKKNLLLVGAVRGRLKDSRIGGQVFACSSLIQSRLVERYDIHGVDSSISSIRSSSRIARIPAAVWRLLKFSWLLLILREPAVMIFCSHGVGVLEKGLMVWLARAAGARCLLLPRSGHLLRQTTESPAFGRLVASIFRSASVVVCQSDYWRSYYRALANCRGFFAVVENWIPEKAFVAPEAPVASSNGQRVVVGYFNRVEREKGVFEFLAAISEVVKSSDDTDAVVFGDGTALEEVRGWISARGLDRRIKVLGWLSDTEKASALRGLDIYVFTSHFEGFPNSLLEAIALKVPVVSVNVGSVPDMLKDGESGILCDIGDVEGLAAGIRVLSKSATMRTRLAEAAYVRARANNNLETAIMKIEALLA